MHGSCLGGTGHLGSVGCTLVFVGHVCTNQSLLMHFVPCLGMTLSGTRFDYLSPTVSCYPFDLNVARLLPLLPSGTLPARQTATSGLWACPPL